MIHILNQKHKIFCWVQDPQLHGVAPHGLAMGDDGVMLGICHDKLPSTIMPALSRLAPMYDDHFGVGEWELVFVPDAEIQELGLNLDFDAAISKNNELAQKAGL